ncbi:MAG: NADH-quinone oxidoreductase subunit C [Hyphomicrobiales bacterium]|nr:NADH-quinone oxidoreductase subunit C [Hyphomicrobiales bacterium]
MCEYRRPRVERKPFRTRFKLRCQGAGVSAFRLLTATEWQDEAHRLAQGEATLVSLWADDGRMRMALREADGALTFVETASENDAFPSVAAVHAPASRLERAACDLFGLHARGARDDRGWLDHGCWPVRRPLSEPIDRCGHPDAYPFLKAEGEGLHQIPVGPVHAGIIEPGHFRFHASGETVVRLEERLGYVHKGVDALLRGASLDRAAVLAGRVSGDSTVAYAIAFSRAAEAALGVEPPARAHWLRGLMAELERIANHFGDIGAISNDAAFALMHAHCGVLREKTLRAAETAFGHRLMMDAVVPGGVADDLAPEGANAIRMLVREARTTFPKLVSLYDNTASLMDRTVATGVLKRDLAVRFGAGGFVGRASGRDFDARRDHPYPPYDRIHFKVPTRPEGDVNARVWVRIGEVFESLDLIDTILARLPVGPFRAPLPASPATGQGHALVEGFRGDVFAHVRLTEAGEVARCHLRDPSWFQWPLLEAAIEGAIVADFPLCNKSFNCSYSGCDL